MEDYEKLKEDYDIFKYSVDQELDVIRKQFESTQSFIKSDAEKNQVLNETLIGLSEYIKTVTSEIKILNLKNENLEILIRTQNYKIETIELKILSLNRN